MRYDDDVWDETDYEDGWIDSIPKTKKAGITIED
jgi:hypothetical protein